MIEVSGIRLSPSDLHGDKAAELRLCRASLLRQLHLAPDDLTSVAIHHRSIDARKKDRLKLNYTVRATLRGGANAERSLLAHLAHRKEKKTVKLVDEQRITWPQRSVNAHTHKRPIVVGAGCAGLFCALALAEAGLEPIILERGDDAERRSQQVRRFNEGGALDSESNIQFGLGGAGTFSDGKLATGTKSPLHRLVLDTFVEAGASSDILWDAHPHVGSDVLPQVVHHIAQRIVELGGDVRFRTRMIDITFAGTEGERQIRSITVAHTHTDGRVSEEELSTNDVILSCGHSARDVFELLQKHNIALERKTFAMGVRIEHLQADVDRSQYGRFAGDTILGAAPYKLVAHLPQTLEGIGGRSAFSFCMCPGGYVVASTSEANAVVTNGMSFAARAGKNANSGLLANVFPDDLPGDDPLEGIKLQRHCERTAFDMGGSSYAAPAQLVGDFLARKPSSGAGQVQPTYPRGVTWTSIDPCLPSYIIDVLRAAIPQLARRFAFFGDESAVLTAVESRSSSPVRITRGENLQSTSCGGLWPAGEGAGYAGGIMSAATDGIRVAQALVESWNERSTSPIPHSTKLRSRS